MKRVIVFGLFFAGIVVSQAQEICDTLKWKILKTDYTNWNGSDYDIIGKLDGAVINIDTLSVFYLGIEVVNISNDTFHSNETFLIQSRLTIYTDTSIKNFGWSSLAYYMGKETLPNDTFYMGVAIMSDLPSLINQLKNVGIELDEINYWKIIIGVGHSSKDGWYSDSVFYAGADTSTFYVVKTPVNIVETDYIASPRQIFPNPARSQFTVTNTENASLQLYNMVGQEILHTQSTEESTIINVSTLPQGLYMLKVVKDGAVRMYKVVISG